MRTLIVWLIGIAALAGGYQVAGRLQRWDDATLFVDCGGDKPCVYSGVVKVQPLTGDYEVQTKDAGTVVVPKSKWQGMSWRAGGIGWESGLALFLGLGIFGLVTVGDAVSRLQRSAAK